ncbi:helix-turn-helix transcriptional regulator [Flagellimonas allohymeniacidonis]|uniref:Helix-turn-helix transcriptional regulator n=1 Tax=Flagellimonas allohymeniacidonis TaxID=2517819 RepID=A0A4Q8QG89_9FLAO|nr:helix-turn-helix transcriptional regulator [Allomuricauda hymeniacidonis]TAI49572.1 helix-turn-helix transcriptional regulator [Allomuricauda hymeniacidonis]
MKLIEREDEMATLQRYANECLDRQGKVVSIYGEAGIGKTSLVNAFLDECRDTFKICQGYCESLFTPRPFGPIYDMSSHLRQDFLKILANGNRAIIFESFKQEILRSKRPIILVFEDVHWADEATLDLIKYLGRRIGQFRCLMLLTHRDTELDTVHPFYKILGEFHPRTLYRIRIAPLSKTMVVRLAKEHDLPGERLYALTQGNPLFVSELLKDQKLEVTENLKDSILSSLNNLTPEENNLLRLISFFPQRVRIDLVHEIDPKGNIDVLMDALLGRELLAIDGFHVGFNHEMVRLAIYESIYPMEKIRLHKEILQVLLKEAQDEINFSSVLHHAIKSRNLDVIRKYAPLGAEEASKWGAHIQASSLYKIAIENSVQNSSKEYAGLLEAYSHECYLTNQLNEGKEAIGSAIRIWSSLDNVREGNAYTLSSRLFWYSGAGEQGLEQGFKAIELLEKYAPSTAYLANAYVQYGHLWALSFRLEEAYEWNRKAYKLSQKLGEKQIQAFSYSSLGLLDIHHSIESSSKGFKILGDSLKMAHEVQDQDLIGRIYSNLYFNYLISGNLSMAEESFGEIKNYFRENDLDFFYNYLKSLESMFHQLIGDWDRALVVAEAALNVSHDRFYSTIVAILTKSVISTRIGSPDAMEFLLEGSRLAMETKEYQFVIPMAGLILEYEWINGEAFPDRSVISYALDLTQNCKSIWFDSLLGFWLKKRALPPLKGKALVEPFKSDCKGSWKKAAKQWGALGIPYYRAMSLSEGGIEEVREAFTILEDLGAHATSARIKKDLRERGMKHVPRGKRSSTLTNPEQLTNRQLEILGLLKEGLTNAEIADRLFISPKTVDHHVSAILLKLHAENRGKAVSLAMEKGIL